MYTPKHFEMPDRASQLEFIRAHPFGIAISAARGTFQATHAPFVILAEEPQLTLGLHIAKANPQWETIGGENVLCIFHGAHDFVSASWYENPVRNVPTWNYSAIHCSGTARLVDDAGVQQILRATVAASERGRWTVEGADEDYIAANRRAIVGIEIAVDAIDGKVKYSQNRTGADRESVLQHLIDEGSPLADEMRAYYEGRGEA